MHAHADPLLNPETSLVVLIDYQAEMFARVKSMDTKVLELKAQVVARACRKFGVPAITWARVNMPNSKRREHS